MNTLMKLSTLVAVFFVVNGHPHSDAVHDANEAKCAAQVLPPDTKTGCCGISATPNKIGNAPQMKLYQDPWIALIEYQRAVKPRSRCSGSLISIKYVLTAGHCITGPVLEFIGKPEFIVLGEFDTSHEGPDCQKSEAGGEICTDGAIRIPIEKSILHPEYDPKEHTNDIALIRMAQPVPYTDFIRPICLPSIDIALVGAPVIFKKAGWALMDSDTHLSPLKMQVTVPYVPEAECRATFNATFPNVVITENELCAGGQTGQDFCIGDGGLPLMYKNSKTYEAIGIVSFGPTACREDIPTVYTNVFKYKSWIMSNIDRSIF